LRIWRQRAADYYAKNGALPEWAPSGEFGAKVPTRETTKVRLA
jgi:hypothetical protein